MSFLLFEIKLIINNNNEIPNNVDIYLLLSLILSNFYLSPIVNLNLDKLVTYLELDVEKGYLFMLLYVTSISYINDICNIFTHLKYS